MSSVALLFLILAVLIIAGVPIGVALGLATLAGLIADGMPIIWFSQKLFNTFDSFPLMAIPFFLLAGDIMQHGTLSKNLLGLCQAFVGHLRGGLAQISTLTCLFYGTLCGSAPATTAAIGGFMIPAMEQEKYPKPFATAINSASGVLGVMIPPSVPLILYGASGMVSITDLFIAGVLPGILVCVAFMVTSNLICRRNGYGIIHEKPRGQCVSAPFGTPNSPFWFPSSCWDSSIPAYAPPPRPVPWPVPTHSSSKPLLPAA